jgi:coenzyme F420-0:L-glutamate ligase / coenzyme F420-1:gamma-L-glutamate ligase
VIINDSHGRAFLNGTVGVAIGVSGLAALVDLRGKPDLFRRRLRTTEVGFADEIASAASLLMGQSSEGRPIVLARGVPKVDGHGTAAELIRAKTLDLFRLPVAAPQSQSVLEAAATELIRGRRSIRNYLDRPVPDAVLEQILDCATCAPSAHNRQPWRFAVLKDAPGKQRLARMMGERLQADLTRDAVPPEVIRKDVERSIARLTGAPIVVVVCLIMDDMDTYHDERRSTAERQIAVQSTAMAMQNLVLAAHAGGLGASIMCAPLFCPDTVRMALELSPHWEPQALVTIGYPASAGKPFKRRPLHEVMRVVDIKP